jgi:Mrp family chromosome partitioning ATPase
VTKPASDTEQGAPWEVNAGPRVSVLQRPQDAAVPARKPQPAPPPEGPRPRPVREQPVDQQLIEACGYAMHQLGGAKLSRLGVLSSIRGEGRTSVAAAIAYAQARDYGRSTLLLDADVDGPDLGGLFGLKQSPGVAEVLRGRAGIDEATHQVDDGLTVMTAGDLGTSPARVARELVSSSLLSELQVEFEVIIADLPALLQSASGALLAEAFEKRVLVVRAAVTPVGRVREAIDLLPAEPAVVLNGARSNLPAWLRQFFS